jgi:subtilisin-like proprotein convertase family protein
VDDGIDLGSTTDVHEDFLDASGASRIAYFLNYTNDAAGDSWLGHGSLTASIAGGYNDTQVSPWYEDAAGYQHGLGIAPYVLLGATKVFGYGLEMLPPYSTWTSNAYNHGARISTNSWSVGLFDGVNVLYNSEARAYDALVRDAVPGTAGNQEMSILFAAGNYGAGPWSVAAPGTGKNVLTVGDSENVRPETLPCSVTEGIADNAADIYYYSSRGPTYDGRKKPDLVAPGTIVMGAASRSDRFDPHPCGPYWPSGQTLYVRSGSSYSVPAVAGAAALARQWFVDRGWGTPSPAMIKAFLMATPTYLTGQLGNDTLPSNAQGYGRVDVGRALDGAPNLRVDQSHVFGATGQTYSLSGTIATSALPFRVMLAWTDAPGPVFGTPWVNNLDLEVTVNGALYRGNVFSGAHSIPGAYADFRNNTEAVFLPAGTTGSFSITVRAKGIYGNGIPGNADYTDQDFALFVYNGTQGAPPPDFAISAAPAEQFVQQGGSADYHLTLSPQNGFDGTVTFFVGGIPDGAAISFSRNPVTTVAGAPVDIALTVTTSAATPAATYPLTITGWNGPIPRSAVVQLVVQLADGPDIVRNYGSFQQFAIGISNDVTSTIMVPHSMTIKSTSVRVDIDHTTRGDLAVSLIGPDGTTVLLHDRTGGTADDLVTTYDISTRSVASLAAFTGRNTLGPWKLRIRSPERATAFSHGELKDWNVMFNGYYTAAPSLAIPDNDAAGVASTIDVSAPGVIEDLRVRVGISHTFKGDLQVSLVGPDGTRVLLHDRTGWFLDDIRTVYPDLTAPVESLDAFVGKRTDGTWRLEVRDLSSVVVGTLDTWEIDFRVFSPFGVSGPRAD